MTEPYQGKRKGRANATMYNGSSLDDPGCRSLHPKGRYAKTSVTTRFNNYAETRIFTPSPEIKVCVLPDVNEIVEGDVDDHLRITRK